MDGTFKVVLPLSVRTDPGLNAARVGDGLQPGQTITVDGDSRTEVDGFVWWRHELGWSAERNADGSRIFLEAVEVVDAGAGDEPSQPTTREFKVLQLLSIRDAPGTGANRLQDVFLNPDEVITVQIASQTEADGYVWWQHDRGWSAEKKSDASFVYMEAVVLATEPVATVEKVTATAETAVESVTTTASTSTETEPALEVLEKESSTFRAVRSFRVIRELSVRKEPGLTGERLPEFLVVGTVIAANDESRIEVDGFVWWQHDQGWSAEKKADGSLVFLGDPDAKPVERSDGTIDPEALPQLNSLFQRSPVELSQTAWIQYFGNTTFAFKNGARWNYPAFSQGLHSGFDYGNGTGGSAPATIQTFAGVEGTFLRNNRFGVAVRSGEYVIMYNHLTATDSFNAGGAVTPDTVIGVLDPGLGSNRHLHLEVRYNREKWIVNPLLLMSESLRSSIVNRWSNFASHFSDDNGFTQWQTPLDQPVIMRGGPVIGPTAG